MLQNYELIDTLGQGANGRVKKVRHRQTDRVYAAKCGPGLQEEAAILNSVCCRYIPKYHEHFHHHSEIWLVMEFCEGGSLFDIMDDNQAPLDEGQVAAVMKMTLRALSYLHQRGITHRDVKAGNILATRTGLCKLADFGAASTDNKAAVAGSPYWMAPELLLETNLATDKADIWSLGITAIELAEMVPPNFDEAPMIAMFASQDRPPPTLTGDKYSEEFRAFVAACLQLAPEHRLSAAQLLQHPFIVRGGGPEVIKDLLQQTYPDLYEDNDVEPEKLTDDEQEGERFVEEALPELPAATETHALDLDEAKLEDVSKLDPKLAGWVALMKAFAAQIKEKEKVVEVALHWKRVAMQQAQELVVAEKRVRDLQAETTRLREEVATLQAEKAEQQLCLQMCQETLARVAQ